MDGAVTHKRVTNLDAVELIAVVGSLTIVLSSLDKMRVSIETLNTLKKKLSDALFQLNLRGLASWKTRFKVRKLQVSSTSRHVQGLISEFNLSDVIDMENVDRILEGASRSLSKNGRQVELDE